MERGNHFWALMDDELVVMMFDGDEYYVCGGWEVPIREERFEFIENIPKPKGYSSHKVYYVFDD